MWGGAVKGAEKQWDMVLILVVPGGDGINTQVEGGASVGKITAFLVTAGRGQESQTLSTETRS